MHASDLSGTWQATCQDIDSILSTMKQQKGTTPGWMRPSWVDICLLPDFDGWADVDVPKLLRASGMAQSLAEAKRILVEQNIVWIDRFDAGEGSTIYDRMEKLKLFLHEGRWLFVEAGQCICIGRTKDEAVCHRINFLETEEGIANEHSPN